MGRLGTGMTGGAALAVAVGLAVLAAPAAAAGPAPGGVDQEYLSLLNQAGVNVRGEEGDALKLGYLACALKQSGGGPIAGTEVFLGAARLGGLCDYVDVSASQQTTCPRSGQWSVECSLAREAITTMPGSGSIADGFVPFPFS